MKEADEEEEEEEIYSGPKSNVSLLDQHSELKKKAEGRCQINHYSLPMKNQVELYLSIKLNYIY